MDQILKEFAGHPLSGEELLKLVDGKANVYTNSQLSKFRTIEEALRPYGAMFILYEKERNKGHWVLVFKNNGWVEYFDPYGYSIDYPIKRFGVGRPYVSKMLSESKTPVIYNKTRLQKLTQDVASCGRWVALRLIMKDVPLPAFIKLFKNSKISGDEYVTLLTMFVE